MTRLVDLVAQDLGVHPIELLAAIAMGLLAAPFVFGVVVGILVAGVTA